MENGYDSLPNQKPDYCDNQNVDELPSNHDTGKGYLDMGDIAVVTYLYDVPITIYDWHLLRNTRVI